MRRFHVLLAAALVAMAYTMPFSLPRSACNILGHWNCTQNGYCVRPPGGQGTDAYYKVVANGNEFEINTAVGEQKDFEGIQMFVHMKITGGCNIDGEDCTFFENELYTPT